MRDAVAVRLATWALYLATPRTRARIHIAIVQGLGGMPSERLRKAAKLSRGPGE